MPSVLIFPSIATLRKALRSSQVHVRSYGCDGDGTDIRLQVTGGGWSLHTGSPDYDLSHRGAWGCGFLPLKRTSLTKLAKQLIHEAREMAAGMGE